MSDTVKKFYKFLEQHGALEEWCAGRSTAHTPLAEFFETATEDLWISGAFFWSTTRSPDGHTWSELNALWCSELCEYE